jgi:hypothetical protein
MASKNCVKVDYLWYGIISMRINDNYDISISGDVMNIKTGRILKTYGAGREKNYKCLRLGVGKKYYIHHLVASKFLPAPTEENVVIDHIDRNTLNNHASNLRWVSYKENANNRTIETTPRSNNKLNELYISKIGEFYRIQISHINHCSFHECLNDAIQFRDAILENAI